MDDPSLGDPDRLQALERSELLDSGAEEVFDRLTRLATRLLGTPIALMTLLDENDQHVKSAVGLELPPRMPVRTSFCQYVVRDRAPFAVIDARDEPRVSDAARQAAVDAGVITYCGVPLCDSDGHTIGSLCTMDTSPRAWTPEEVQGLRDLAASAMAEVRLRVANRRLLHQRRLEDELAASADRFRRTFDDAPTGILLCSADRRIISANHALCEMVGYSQEELLGTTMREITHPDDRELEQQVVDAVLADDTVAFSTGKRYVHRDGHTVYARLSASLVRDADGAPSHFVAHIEDVSAERESRRAQRAVEQRHRRLLGELPDTMVVLYDTSGRCVLLQGGLLAEMGIDAEDHVGKLVEEQISTEQSRVLPGLVRRALAGESVTIDHDTGQGSHFEIGFAPYCEDDDDTISGAFMVWRDVTARVRREADNRMLATMVQQSEDSIIAKDRDGTILEWNQGAERLYGYTRDEAIGQPIAMIVPDGRTDEDRELLSRALAGESIQLDTVRMCKSGRRVDVAIRVSPLMDAGGTVTGASVISRDITERIRAQTARHEIEERLRVTVEHAPIGVAVVDLRRGPPGRLLNVNEAFGTLFGDPDPVGAGLALTSVVHCEDADALRADLALLASDDSARIESEVRFMHPDGRTRWLLITGAAVPSDHGGPHLAVLHALDIGDRKHFEGQLQHLADHDALTGLFNRRRFAAELTRMVALTDRYAQEGALLLIDLDGFKRVNDTLGHSYGDELIARVASCLRRCLRETDVIGRLGGDEFAIILPRADAVAATTAAEKVLHAVAEHGTVRSGDHRMSVTASIGVAALSEGTGNDAEALLVAADTAMYAAKQQGRNQIAFAANDGAGPRALAAERSWLTRLRTALDHDRLEIYAQPILPICGAPVDRMELLLRMHGENGELIAPAAFLHNAERFDLIQEIDRWVFARALTLLANCHAAGRDVSLGVNMSGRTLCDPRLVGDLTAMIAACPIPRDRLIVEVTETAAIVNIERARDVARALRALGCQFALDDFGSGFASFFYLKHLQFDFVKIDGEFVRGLAVNPADSLIVASVVDLAHRLGAETIAEFIEDAATLTQVRTLGVDHGQGYHLGRPLPVAEALPEGQALERSLTIESSSPATSATIRSATASSASV